MMQSGREGIRLEGIQPEMGSGMQEGGFGIRGSPLSCESAIRRDERMPISHRKTRRGAFSWAFPCELRRASRAGAAEEAAEAETLAVGRGNRASDGRKSV